MGSGAADDSPCVKGLEFPLPICGNGRGIAAAKAALMKITLNQSTVSLRVGITRARKCTLPCKERRQYGGSVGLESFSALELADDLRPTGTKTITPEERMQKARPT